MATKILGTDAVLRFIGIAVLEDKLAVTPAKCAKTGADIRVLVMTRPTNDPNGGVAAYPLAILIEGDPMLAILPPDGGRVIDGRVQPDGTVHVSPV